MPYKIILIVVLGFFSATAFACFNDSGCPKGNVCIKTGNLLGICLSQGPFTTNSIYPTNPPPASEPATNTPSASRTQIPSIPPPAAKTAGTCTQDINCQAGYVCSRPFGRFYGLCTEVLQ